MKLATKVSWLVSSMIGVSLLLATLITTASEQRMLRHHVQTQYRTTVRQIGEALHNTFRTLNWLFMEKMLTHLQEDENVLFCHLVNPQGSIYMSSDQAMYGEEADPRFAGGEERVLPLDDGETQGIVFIQPVEIGQSLWTVAMGVSYGFIQEQMRQVALRMAWLALLLCLLLGVVAYLLSRQITRPLKQLTGVCQTISEGHLTETEPIRSNDEIGVFSTTFSFMIDAIAARDKELSVTNLALQEKVEIIEQTNRQLEAAIGNATELARQAQAANRAKTAFLNKVSHELRTPLHAILGYAQLSVQHSNDDEIKHWLGIVHQSGEQLLRLINDILSISRIEGGQLEIKPVVMDLPDFLERLICEFSAPARRKGLGLRLERAGLLPVFVKADEARLREVIANLLDNAIKFSHKGQVILRVIRRDQAESTAHLHFEVEDTGPGIASEQLPELFQPFRQVEQSAWVEGAGLGLAVSRQLVRMMGGDLVVASRPDQGSTFWFEVVLPITEGPARSNQATVTTSPRPREFSEPHLTGKVDDDAIPPRAILSKLLDLARMGDLHAILDCLREIDAMEARYAPFTTLLGAWARAYEEKKILSFLQKYAT